MERLRRLLLDTATLLSLLLCIAAAALLLVPDFHSVSIIDGTRRSFAVRDGKLSWLTTPNWPYRDPMPAWIMGRVHLALFPIFILTSLLPSVRAWRRRRRRAAGDVSTTDAPTPAPAAPPGGSRP